MKRTLLIASFFLAIAGAARAQAQDTAWKARDEKPRPLKLEHAEPLYIDLIRDLGAHRGEREWNVGWALVDRGQYASHEFLVEYEWAVLDRWGLEIEVPLTFHSLFHQREQSGNGPPARPSHRVESLKLATQYTFLVSGKWQTSMALGGIVELEWVDLDKLRHDKLFQGILYNPFFIAAKRWGPRWHTLVYTGPRITRHFGYRGHDFSYELNFNLHCSLFPDARHFVGVEWNALWDEGRLGLVARPQMRLEFSEQLMLGLAPGIPLTWRQGEERLSFFMRLIYEPSHHSSKPKRGRATPHPDHKPAFARR
jgi:hypothetical protein